MPLKLTILGSGAAVPTLGRSVTAQYLNFSERRILIDCGEGTQLQIRKRQKKLQRINYILISHAHADHILGLPGLIATMSLLGRKNDLQIYCPAAVKDLIDFQFKLLEIRIQFKLHFKLLNYKDKTEIFSDNLIKISAFPLNHRIECYGFLFEEKEKENNIIPSKINEFQLSIPEIVKLKRGISITRDQITINPEDATTPASPAIRYAFCTDTRPVDSVKDWCKGADIMYHEATFLSKQQDRAKKTYHSTAKEAAQLAKETGIKHLLLGHFSARFSETDLLSEEANQFHENVTCVEDGDEFIR